MGIKTLTQAFLPEKLVADVRKDLRKDSVWAGDSVLYNRLAVLYVQDSELVKKSQNRMLQIHHSKPFKKQSTFK